MPAEEAAREIPGGPPERERVLTRHGKLAVALAKMPRGSSRPAFSLSVKMGR